MLTKNQGITSVLVQSYFYSSKNGTLSQIMGIVILHFQLKVLRAAGGKMNTLLWGGLFLIQFGFFAKQCAEGGVVNRGFCVNICEVFWVL